MTYLQPKQTLRTLFAILLLSATIVACNNNADTSKAGTDTSKMSDSSAMHADSSHMMDTSAHKMDTASTRPVKTSN